MPDQAGGDRIKDLAQRKAARGGDADENLLMVRRPPGRQRVQSRALLIDALGVGGVAAPDDFVDKAPPGGEIVEIARAAQQERVLDRLLEMAMGALDRAVFMSEACIVAGRRHAVMGAKIFVAAGEVQLGLAIQIAESSR